MVKICVSRREYEHKNGYKTCRIEIRVAYSSHLVFRVEGNNSPLRSRISLAFFLSDYNERTPLIQSVYNV